MRHSQGLHACPHMHAHAHTHTHTSALTHTSAACLSCSACSVRVPLIEARPSEIDLGSCYLYFPYSACVELINRSELFASYSLQEQVRTHAWGGQLEVRHCKRNS